MVQARPGTPASHTATPPVRWPSTRNPDLRPSEDQTSKDEWLYIRRISRDGHGQRSSRCATTLLERERTERRIWCEEVKVPLRFWVRAGRSVCVIDRDRECWRG